MDDVVSLVAPMVALVVWTIVVLFWATFRIQSAIRAKDSSLDLSKLPRGSRGRDIEEHLPREVSWPRRNYEHLVEQPVLFYAIMACLALMHAAHMINIWLAWGYVGFRIIHSFQQIYGKARSIGFVGSSLCLIGLTVHAALEVIHHI